MHKFALTMLPAAMLLGSAADSLAAGGYIGCFQDQSSPRALPTLLFSSNTTTIENYGRYELDMESRIPILT
jgi:hypothetical protein